MKRISMIVLLVAFAGSVLFAWNGPRFSPRAPSSIDGVVRSTSESPPDEEEIAGLLFMKEEEKLARDVYRVLYDQWGLRAFANIARSEQAHMDAIDLLIERYGLEDPASEREGEFSDPALQSLYDELTAKGAESLAAALAVGAEIEDLDIADLQERLDGTDKEDIAVVYQNLLKGSRNHYRTFVGQLARFGVEYEPRHISADYSDRILTTRIERRGAITDPGYLF